MFGIRCRCKSVHTAISNSVNNNTVSQWDPKKKVLYQKSSCHKAGLWCECLYCLPKPGLVLANRIASVIKEQEQEQWWDRLRCQFH